MLKALAALFLLTIFLYSRLKNTLSNLLVIKEKESIGLEAEYKDLARRFANLKESNSHLEKRLNETISLYEITKDICKTLDEDEIFNIFSERVNNLIRIENCKFFKTDTQPGQLRADTVALPLIIKEKPTGFLVVEGIQQEDKVKFQILAKQFLVGIKRALLYKEIQELAIIDSLTQIFTRRHFLERFDEEVQRSRKFKLKFSFLMIDIDHFKNFNDNYGHLVGDAILWEVAKTIKETIRQIDFMGRYGGEELSVILTETDKEQAKYVAERIRQVIESKYIRVYDETLRVTISIGVSTFPMDAIDGQALIGRADEALYLAKQAGRNRVHIYKGK